MDSIQTDDPDQPQASRTLNASSVQTVRTRPPILRAVIGVIVAVIIIIILIFLARWIYHKVHHKAVHLPAVTQKTPVTHPSGKTSGNHPADKNPPSPSSSTTQLTNTGPGNVAGIFITASLAAAGLHYIISIRKTSSS